MNTNTNIYVKINYKLENSNSINLGMGAHINNCEHINSTKYLIAGGIYNKNRGALLFNARSLEEAEEIANNKKFINNNLKYEVIIEQ